MIVRRTKTYAVCPHCQQDAGWIDHLLGRETQTSWYCDACGGRYQLTFHADGMVDIAPLTDRKVTTRDLLVLPPQTSPVYFIVPGMRFEGRDAPHDEEQSNHYFYEEHSCPTNWLRPEVVYFEGDSDPHGLIEYIARLDEMTLPPEEITSPNSRDEALLAWIEQHAKVKP